MKDPRNSFAKALRKLRPESADLVMNSVDHLIEVLSGHHFHLTGTPSDGVGPFWDRLFFERRRSEDAFEYISVSFADDGQPSFGSLFGIREYADPDNWHCNAYLSRRRVGLWRSCDLGARWFLPFKEQAFLRDWQFLLDNVDDIVRFLETGKRNRNMAYVQIFEPFEPR